MSLLTIYESVGSYLYQRAEGEVSELRERLDWCCENVEGYCETEAGLADLQNLSYIWDHLGGFGLDILDLGDCHI